MSLPDPKSVIEASATAEGGREPDTVTELRMASLWREVFGVARVRRSDFIELGGHSLLAMQLLRVGRAFGMDLPIATLLLIQASRHLAGRSTRPREHRSLVEFVRSGEEPMGVGAIRIHDVDANLSVAVALEAIPESSGDQVGFQSWLGSWVSLVEIEPFAFTTWISGLPSLVPANAIRVPSADQAGSKPSESVSPMTPEPSAPMT